MGQRACFDRLVTGAYLEIVPEATATFTLDRQVARARADMGEEKWRALQAEWDAPAPVSESPPDPVAAFSDRVFCALTDRVGTSVTNQISEQLFEEGMRNV